MKKLSLILSSIIVVFMYLAEVSAFSKEYYEKKGYDFNNHTFSAASIGKETNLTFDGKVNETKVHEIEKMHQCDPENLEINVYDDRKCSKLNQGLTTKAQLTEKQKKQFLSCQLLSKQQKIYGKVDCKDDGFVIAVFTDKDCTKHATKGGKPYHQSIYYGRCHREKEGSKIFFRVRKLDPEAMKKAEEEKEKKLKKAAAAKAVKNATKSANVTKKNDQDTEPVGIEDDEKDAPEKPEMITVCVNGNCTNKTDNSS